MSWLYSRALVAEYSAATCSDGARSALSSGSHMPQAFLRSDKMTAFSRLSRFGMTFKPLMDDLGAELLTWFLAASRARTSALPERALASAANDPGCGPTWRASLARFDPDTSSWKTVQLCLLGDSELSSVIWPRSGMTADGQCWELPMSEHRTSGTGSGSWPTPVASDTSSRSKPYAQGGTPLSLAVKWPTPRAKDGKGAQQPGAATLARMRGYGPNLSEAVVEQSGGQLNPTWVEWLMGWPLGWTDLKPLETDRSHSAPLQRGAC